MVLNIASVLQAYEFEESKFTLVMERFTTFKASRMEQRTCLINLAHGKDVFAIIHTNFKQCLSQVSCCYEIKERNFDCSSRIGEE